MNSMKVAAISDVHIKTPHDQADQLLCNFLSHPSVTNSQYVALLGDIFDLMCGSHPQYLEQFGHIFDALENLHKKHIKVLFFEGNHDVHLEELFKLRWPNQEIKPLQYPVIEMIDGKSYYFSHGDEHEVDNLSYQRYKAFIVSPPLKFIANKLMPYGVLKFVGEKASKRSRKRGAKSYNEDLVKNRFRRGVKEVTDGRYNFILGGHSHVKDIFQINNDSTYINNGYAQRTKSFILIEDHKFNFIELS